MAQSCLERHPAKEGWPCTVPYVAVILCRAVIATSNGGCVPSLAGVKKSWQARESTSCYASRNTTFLSFNLRALILIAISTKCSSLFIKGN